MAGTIDIRNLWRALSRVSAEALAAGKEGCYRAAVASRGPVQQTINKTAPYPPVDTGVYRNAWQAIRTTGGADLLNPAPYAGVIEVGRGPHQPNERDLLEWARRKVRKSGRRGGGGGRGPGRGGGRGPRPAPAPISDAERARRIIAAARRKAKRRAQQEAEAQALFRKALRSIKKYGIKPRDILLRSEPAMGKILERELDRAARQFERGNGLPPRPR